MISPDTCRYTAVQLYPGTKFSIRCDAYDGVIKNYLSPGPTTVQLYPPTKCLIKDFKIYYITSVELNFKLLVAKF